MKNLASKPSLMFNQERLIQILKLWRERSRQRKALTQLSPYLLKDIGISRSDAINEVQKPFWKP